MEVVSGRTEGWVENRPTGGWRALDIHELWDYRELVAFLALRDLKSRYKQAFFGVGWTLAQPLAGTAALVLVFRRLVKVPSEGLPYAVFALVGYAVWSYVSGAIGVATGSLVDNSTLITKVYFPRLTVPLAALLPELVDLGLAFGAIAVLMVIEGVGPPAALILLPVDVLFAMAVALGVGLWLATWNVRYRDVGYALGFLLQLWFFVSPVAYPPTLVHGVWRHVYALNPVDGLIGAFRATILGAPASVADIGISVLMTALVLATGMLCFLRLERRFADVI